jgi:uncharacterized integral membrane protein
MSLPSSEYCAQTSRYSIIIIIILLIILLISLLINKYKLNSFELY